VVSSSCALSLLEGGTASCSVGFCVWSADCTECREFDSTFGESFDTGCSIGCSVDCAEGDDCSVDCSEVAGCATDLDTYIPGY
jgi:hypothetical protein